MEFTVFRKGEPFAVYVDDDDMDLVSRYKWYIDDRGYVWTNDRKNGVSKLYMHRLLMNPTGKLIVDHINHNRQDNRKSNLRLCTRQQNNWNRKIIIGYSSKYKGVSYNKTDKVWEASVHFNDRKIRLGGFKSEIEAAMIYNTKAKELFGDFACLNIFTKEVTNEKPIATHR